MPPARSTTAARFTWNSFLCRPLLNQGISERWFTPVPRFTWMEGKRGGRGRRKIRKTSSSTTTTSTTTTANCDYYLACSPAAWSGTNCFSWQNTLELDGAHILWGHQPRKMSSMPKHQQNCKIERSNRAEYQLAPSEKLNQKRTQKESSRNLYVSQVFDTPKGNHQINCFVYRWQIAKVTVVTLSKTMKAKTFGSWVASSFAEILFQNCLTEQVWFCFDFRIEKKD